MTTVLNSLSGNLALLQEDLVQNHPDRQALLDMAQQSQTHADRIAAVLKVLQRVTRVKQTSYHGQIRMLDIESALREELE